MTTITLEIAWTATTFQTVGVSWTNESTRLRSMGPIVRGVSTDTGGFEPGRATFVMSNETRRFEPYYSGSPLYPNIAPRKQVRVSIGSNVIWRGYTDSFTPDYPSNGKDAICTIECVDIGGLMAQTPVKNVVEFYTLSHNPSHYYRCNEMLYEAAPPPFYGPAKDSSGNANTGTYAGVIVGALRYGVQGPNLTEKAFEVVYSTPPAQQAYLEMPAYPHSTGDLTLQWWVRTTATAGQVIVNQANATGGRHLGVAIRADGKLDIQDTNGVIYTTTGPVALNDGSWHQLSLTKVGADLFMDFDGVSMGAWVGWPTPLLNQTHSVTFGRAVGTSITNIVVYQGDRGIGQKLDTLEAMQGKLSTLISTRWEFILEEAGFPEGTDSWFETADLLPLDYDEKTTKVLDALNQLSQTEGVPWVPGATTGEPNQYPRDLAFGGRARSTTSQMTLSATKYQHLRLLSDSQDRAYRVTVQHINNGPWAEAVSGTVGLPDVRIETAANCTQGQLQDFADWEAACRNPDRLRIGEVTVIQDGAVDTSGLDLLDRVTLTWNPPGGGGAISQDTLITGMTWTGVPGGIVTCVIRCNPKWLLAAP